MWEEIMGAEPWLKSYPKGVRYDAELAVMPIPQLLDDAAARWPAAVALEFMGKTIRYGELAQLVDRAARGFQDLGVGPGVHVGLFLPNVPQYVISFFGILKAGGTVVNYSPLEPPVALAHKIADSATDIMVTLDVQALYPQMEQLLHETRLRKLVVGSIGVAQCPVPVDDEHLRFEHLLANDGHFAPPRLDVADVAVLQYTGGTTGEPKGAMLTHANLSAACSQYVETASGDRRVIEPGRERVLIVLPLFHIYALTVDLLFGIRMGAEMILHLRFEPEPVLRDIATKRVSILPAVPTIFSAIANHPDVGKYDLSSLKFCGSGGAPLPLELQQQFERLANCTLLEGWGMTETAPAGTFSPLFGPRKPGSCGLPMPGVRLKFTDVAEPSRDVALGERGEICIAGPNVMKGYWNKPAATAAAFTADGFLRTGDVGYMDEDGFVYIVDRTKDMILCSGFNVYPRNIEEAIYQHPSVLEVTVIGIDDAYRGQSPKAFIKLKPGAPLLTLAELNDFLRSRLGKHELPAALELRAELPKTAVGKLSKKELYEEEKRKRGT
jgi:long-chain acyl-CoA synthetase